MKTFFWTRFVFMQAPLLMLTAGAAGRGTIVVIAASVLVVNLVLGLVVCGRRQFSASSGTASIMYVIPLIELALVGAWVWFGGAELFGDGYNHGF